MIIQTISALCIVVIALIFLNSPSLTMPMNTASMLALGLAVAFLAFAAVVFKERPADEREAVHALMAGRISYLVGIGVLVAAIMVQAFQHNIDAWLVITLCTMVITKLASRLYSYFRM